MSIVSETEHWEWTENGVDGRFSKKLAIHSTPSKCEIRPMYIADLDPYPSPQYQSLDPSPFHLGRQIYSKLYCRGWANSFG